MTSSNDLRFQQHVNIKNNSNFITNSSLCNFYLSTDTLLSSNDRLISSIQVPRLPPYKNHLIEINTSTPNGFIGFKYLLFELDANNANIEINELNNLSYLELNMDSTSGFHFPVFYNFDASEADGWSWYQDHSGRFNSNHRFAISKTPDFSIFNNTDHHWYLEPQYNLWDYDNYPIHFLESPTYDFTNAINTTLQFDFVCAGSGYDLEGGRLEYSINGGSSWIALGNYPDTNGVNWYTAKSIGSIGGGPGWTNEHEWTTAEYHADILNGKPSVKFRFIFRSNTQIAVPFGLTGFKLDNFKITADYCLKLTDIVICKGDTVNVFGVPRNTEGTYYQVNPSNDTVYSQLVINNIVDTSIMEFFNHLSSNAANATYQWLDCDNGMSPIVGETSQTFYPSRSGSFALEVTDNGCSETSSCHDFNLTGIIQSNFSTEISLYPNPVTDFIQLNLGKTYQSILVTITSLDGKTLDQRTYKSSSEVKWNLNLPTGSYLISIATESKETATFKVLKR
jgi:hypothetical protein